MSGGTVRSRCCRAALAGLLGPDCLTAAEPGGSASQRVQVELEQPQGKEVPVRGVGPAQSSGGCRRDQH